MLSLGPARKVLRPSAHACLLQQPYLQCANFWNLKDRRSQGLDTQGASYYDV
jgi:hypothetical protein